MLWAKVAKETKRINAVSRKAAKKDLFFVI
jgi:hypothetical protein